MSNTSTKKDTRKPAYWRGRSDHMDSVRKRQGEPVMNCMECALYKTEPDGENKKPACPKAKATLRGPDVYTWPRPSTARCAAFEPAVAEVVAIYRGFTVHRDVTIRKKGVYKGSYTGVMMNSTVEPPTAFTGKNMAEVVSQIDFYLHSNKLARAA